MSDPAEVVRTFAESAVRQAVAHRSTDEVLIGHRDEVERETLAILAGHLDRAGAGVRVTAVTLRDVHAPEEVHFAYRDVASALEDKDRSIRRAEGFRTDTLARARGEAEKLLNDGDTTVGGRIPVNPSGGLACFGEAVPAQAVAQVCELTWQLRGQAGERQVEGARAGITANQGLFGHGSSVILKK